MSFEAIGRLVDKWMNDPKFREEIRKDPEGTLKKTSFGFTYDELQAFKDIDWSVSDEELKQRVSKLLA